MKRAPLATRQQRRAARPRARWIFRACPRCNGDLEPVQDGREHKHKCVQCSAEVFVPRTEKAA